MRYLSMLFIAGLLYWSWSVIRSPLNIPETTHIDIQEDIKLMISETIYTYLPTVQAFRFDRFWTQNIDAKTIKAVFSFSFENSAESVGAARYGIEGYALLNYDNAKDVWNVEGPVFNNNAISFKDGLVITPGSDGE